MKRGLGRITPAGSPRQLVQVMIAVATIAVGDESLLSPVVLRLPAMIFPVPPLVISAPTPFPLGI